MLDTKLIENALALTGKTMDDMKEAIHKPNTTGKYKFSIEKFCYYLLSPEFMNAVHVNNSIEQDVLSQEIGLAIRKYQLGIDHYLIELLSKICQK